MAIPLNYVGTPTLGQVPGAIGSGNANRENLEDWIINLDRTETPLIASIGSEETDSIFVDWQTETLRNPRTNAVAAAPGPLVYGKAEGLAFAAEVMTVPYRKRNVCQIFESFWGLTRTQITVARKGGTAGIRNLAGHYSKKVMAELLTAVEARILSTFNATGSTTDPRQMKTADDATAGSGMLIDMNAAGLGYGTNILDLGGAQATEINFQTVLQATWRGGVRVSDIHLSPGWKRKVSMTFVGYGQQAAPLFRNTDAKTVVAVVDTYTTDFGSARLVNNVWVTEVAEHLGSDDVSAGLTTGRIWFFQRDLIKLVWLDRFQSNMMGRIGDGLGFQTVGELTVMFKSDRMGKIKNVGNAT